MLGRYVVTADELVAAAGLMMLWTLVTTAAPSLDARGWDVTVLALMGAAEDDPLARLAAGEMLHGLSLHSW